ncbi:hypothetical protein BHE74_00026912 [Ensete ventricosum]|nr:hypothetical protein GW17_00014489 [Ensete ventricosum]RWW65779.1 hypothetical protein BHE74_00026912 [Ensete ventricosum]RZS27900.1 hypothetical protein BHM03_00061438 [Ensete ventricosum]
MFCYGCDAAERDEDRRSPVESRCGRRRALVARRSKGGTEKARNFRPQASADRSISRSNRCLLRLTHLDDAPHPHISFRGKSFSGRETSDGKGRNLAEILVQLLSSSSSSSSVAQTLECRLLSAEAFGILFADGWRPQRSPCAAASISFPFLSFSARFVRRLGCRPSLRGGATMASWEQLGELSTVAQLTGLDAVRLIGLIVQAATTARMHRKNCRQFAQHLKLIGNLLEQLKISELKKYPETREPLEQLEDALRRSYILVDSCQNRSYLYLLAMGWNIVYQFRRAQNEIDRYLRIVPLITLVDNARVRVSLLVLLESL